MGGYLLLQFCLATPWAARQASRLLTDRLGQPVTVAGLHLSGATLAVNGLQIANLPGYADEPLAAARTVVVAPEWLGLVAGRTSFRLIGGDGVRISARQNRAGTWNFAGLGARLAARKSDRETTIGRLTLTDASLLVNGRGFERISLNVSDLATKGSSGSRLQLSFRDANGSAFRIEGEGRLGARPSLDVSLTAPAIALRSLAGARLPIDLANGTASLRLTARLQAGKLVVDGESRFDRLALRFKAGPIPIRGSLGFRASYDLTRDAAVLERCVLNLDGLTRLEATARVREVKGGRSFSAEVAGSDIELGRLANLIPSGVLHELDVAGRLHPGRFRLAGDGRRGITTAEGRFALSGGELAKGGRPLLRGLTADAVLARGELGWSLRGRLTQPATATGGMVEGLVAPFTVALSSRFKLLECELPAIAARFAGLSLRGMLAYRPTAAVPFIGTVELPEVTAAAANPYLAAREMRLTSGRGSLIVRAAGRGPADFQATLAARMAGLQGTAGSREFALHEATTRTVISRAAGTLTVTGNLQASGARLGETSGTGAFDYRLAGGSLAIGNCVLRLAGGTLRCADIHGPLPGWQTVSDGRQLPVRLAFSGVGWEKGAIRMAGLEGNFSGAYRMAKGKQWLEGTGDAALQELAVRGAEVGSLAGGFRSAATGLTADLTGRVLGGSLAVRVSLDPFATGEGWVSLALPSTPAAELLTAFASLLPRPLQDAAATGTLAAGGTLRITGRDLRLDGELTLANVGVEAPAQKLSIAGVSGQIPFSIVTAGTTAARPAEGMGFTRENYPSLLQKLQRQESPGKIVKIGRIRFGSLELGETTLVMRAGNGLTELASLASNLYQGGVFGAGYLRFGGGATYGADFLLNDLSLKAFCNSFPAIKGYISGRVDGIVSLRGEGSGLNGLAGFVDLWARPGPEETMLVSKEFLQRLAGRKLKGIFFRNDRPYDRGEISAYLERGYLTFDVLDIYHTNFFGIRDLSVQVAPVQNRIAIDHLFTAIKTAAARGKGVAEPEALQPLPETEFKWQE